MTPLKLDDQQKQFLVLVIVLSFLVSSSAGWLSGNLSRNINQTQVFDGLSISELLNDASSTPLITMPSDDNSSQNQVKVISQQDLVVAAVKKASPAVVSVIISKDVPIVEQYYSDPFGGDPFFNQFFGGDNFRFQIPQYKQNGTEKREIGGGTGFIISSDGLILTNKHVVEDESAEYTVLTNDGEKYPAEVLARDLIQDLAIIKIDKKDLPVLNLSNSDNIKIGQTVIAIGNALGEFRNTVSVGVVSGLQRQITAGSGVTSEDLEELIQTDAAINHGNSGGPLLNLAGEVIGVNVAIAQGAQNIGFSIPINKASKDIQQVKSLGKISIPFLGVRYVLINDQVKSKNNLSYNYGAWVQKGSSADQPAVSADSSAEKAGIMEGDIILEVSGKIIDQNHTLAKAIQEYNVGDSISLKIWRQDSEKNINLKLGERP